MPARRLPRGLSLIELLVVIAVIAVLAAAALLSADLAGGARHAQREAERFATVLELACERAEIGGGVYGIHFANGAYAFSQQLPEGWLIERDGALSNHALAAGVTLTVEREGEAIALDRVVTPEPVAACHPSGEISPFRAAIVVAGTPAIAIVAAEDGTIDVDEVVPP